LGGKGKRRQYLKTAAGNEHPKTCWRVKRIGAQQKQLARECRKSEQKHAGEGNRMGVKANTGTAVLFWAIIGAECK